MRKKLQNSKVYAESLEFLPALGLFISIRSPSLQFEVNYIPSLLDYKKKLYTNICVMQIMIFV